MPIQDSDLTWVPEACTLPTADQPHRAAEFDALFGWALRGFDRLAPTRLALNFGGGPDVEATVRDLTVREAQCCSFFTFVVVRHTAALFDLEVSVAADQVGVLDALTARVGSIPVMR